MIRLGFKAPIIKWFESYLLNSKFYVSVDGVFSEAGVLTCDFPWGSILGSLLFLIYINELPQLLSESGSYLYGDETCILYQDKDVH